jgi:hypothetical protein
LISHDVRGGASGDALDLGTAGIDQNGLTVYCVSVFVLIGLAAALRAH